MIRRRSQSTSGRVLTGAYVRRACIDIGSNTTRLLIAECGDGLVEVHQERAYTQLRRSVRDGGALSSEKISEVVAVVEAQLARARGARLGGGARGRHRGDPARGQSR